MTVLVVGGSGFIGRHLCDYLLQRQYAVVATTRSPRPADEREGIEYRQLNLLDDGVAEFDLSGVNCVIYLAARTHVLRESEADPLAAYRKINVDAAVDFAARAAAQGVARFIYVSSIGVNGLCNNEPFRETDPPDPQEPYAQSKLEAEQLLIGNCRKDGIELVILRPVLVYGADAPGNFARLQQVIRAGRPLPIGGFDNSRSLIAIENLVQLLEICIRHPQAANQLFLAADGDDVSSPALARKIGEAIGKPARLVNLPLWLLRPVAGLLGKSRELERLCGSLRVDIGKARDLLGWKPALSLQQALQKLPRVN